MTATIGWFSVLLAFALALVGIIVPVLTARREGARALAVGVASIVGQLALVTVAGIALVYALVAADFSLKYVATNSSLRTPLYYRVTGLWGAACAASCWW